MQKVEIVAKAMIYTEASNLQDVKNNALKILIAKLRDIKPTIQADQSNGGLVTIKIEDSK